MKPIFIGIFTLVLVFVWIFFIIANIHAKKFKNFSNNISIFTKILFIFLLVLSILGYLIIVFGNISFWESPSSINVEKIFGENIIY